MACAATAAERGHSVTLFDAAPVIGGQFNLARRIPGKEEFGETLRYFDRRLKLAGVTLRLDQRVNADELVQGGFDQIVLATGIVPRKLEIQGGDHAKVVSYLDLIEGRKKAGARAAIIGAGGIGFDVGEFLTHAHDSTSELAHFQAEWGIDTALAARGGLKPSGKGDAHTPGLVAATKDFQSRQRSGKDHRLNSPFATRHARRRNARRRHLRTR